MDRVSTEIRSKIMAKVKSKGNRSTERRLRACLASLGIRGWTMHSKAIPGRPDFSFEDKKVAIFVDGCFWHGCPNCCRRPNSRQDYWNAKIDKNMQRDLDTTKALEATGWVVYRIWEHEIKSNARNIASKIQKLVGQQS